MVDGGLTTGDPTDQNKLAEEQRNPFREAVDQSTDPAIRKDESGRKEQLEEHVQMNPFEEKDSSLPASENKNSENLFTPQGINNPEDERWDASPRHEQMTEKEEQNLVEVYLSRRQLSFCIAKDSISEAEVERFQSREPTAREDFLHSPEEAILVFQGHDLPDDEEALSPVLESEFDEDNEKAQDRRRLTLDVELKGLQFNSPDTDRQSLSSKNQIPEDEVTRSESEDASHENKSELSASEHERSPAAPIVEKESDAVESDRESEKLNYLAMFEEELEEQQKSLISEAKISSRDISRINVHTQPPAEDIIEQFDVLSPHNPRKVALLKEREQTGVLDMTAELNPSVAVSEDNSTSAATSPRLSKTEEYTEQVGNVQNVLENVTIPEPPTPMRSKRKELEIRLNKMKQLSLANNAATSPRLSKTEENPEEVSNAQNVVENVTIPEPPKPVRSKRKELETRFNKMKQLGLFNKEDSGKPRALQKLADAISTNETLMGMLFKKKQAQSNSTSKLVEGNTSPDNGIFGFLDKDFAKPLSSEPELPVSDKSFDILKNVTNEDQSQETLSALEEITKTVDALDVTEWEKSGVSDMKLERYRANCMELLYHMIKKKLRRLEEIQEIEICRGLRIVPGERQMKMIQKQTDETERELNRLREKLLGENWWLEKIPSNSMESIKKEPSLDPKGMNQVFEPIASTFNSILTLDDQTKELFTRKLEGLHAAIEEKNLELQNVITKISELHTTNLDEKNELEAQVFDLKSKLLELEGKSHGGTAAKGSSDQGTTQQLTEQQVGPESTISPTANPFREDGNRIHDQLSEQIMEVQRQQIVSNELRQRLSELLRIINDVKEQHPEIKELIPDDVESIAVLAPSDYGGNNMLEDVQIGITDSAQPRDEAIASSPNSSVSSPHKDETKELLENSKEISESPAAFITEERKSEGDPQDTKYNDRQYFQQDEDKPAEEEESSAVEEETQIDDSQFEELRSKLHDVRMSKLSLIETTSSEINFLRNQIDNLTIDLKNVRRRELEQERKIVAQKNSSWFSSLWTQKPTISPKRHETMDISDRWKEKSVQVLNFSREIERLRDIIRVLVRQKGSGNVPLQLHHDFVRNVPAGSPDNYERDMVDYTVDLP